MNLKEALAFIQEELNKLKDIREIIYTNHSNRDKALVIKEILERK